MNHPNIASVYDAGATNEGRPYFAMELVHGEPITDYCDKNRLTIKERLGLFILVCEGVQHAHQKGIIHRDIKPSNILITIQDDKPVPKIIDFGVAKATSQRLTERTVYTELGQLIGTPEYMSPEQAEMTGIDIDTRTDVYSLGVVLYELLVGAQPFDAKELRQASFDDMRRKIREEEPPRPSTRLSLLGEPSTTAAKNRRVELRSLERDLQGDLDWITMKALEKDRTRRYGSPSDLSADIVRHLKHEPVLASPPSTVYRATKFVRRHLVGVASVTAIALLLVALLVGMTVQAARIAREAAKAKAINEFLQETLGSADTFSKLGREVTVVEALDESARTIDESFQNQPEIEAAVKNTIGYTYMTLGRYEDAEPLLKSALETRKARLGEWHLETLDSMHSLAALYIRHGHLFEEAEQLLSKAMEGHRRALGEEHPDSLSDMNELALVYEYQGRHEEAERIYSKTFEISRRVLGEEDPKTLRAMSGLVGIHWVQGRSSEAEKLARRLLDLRRRVSTDQDPGTVRTIHQLALIYSQQGRYSEAEPLAVEALDLYSRVLGEEHSYTLISMSALALLYAKQGRYEEAEELYLKTIDIQRRVLGDENSETMRVLGLLASLYRSQDLCDKAEPLYAEVVAVLKRVKPRHYGTGVMLKWQGVCLATLGRYDEAEVSLLEAHSISESTLGAYHEKTLDAAQSLVGLYETWGKPEKAAEYRAMLEEEKESQK
jgi:non-specific serine/threonine protein kinase/serine/threonine-protein kinase